MSNTPRPELVVDFSGQDELARWSPADDVVMGGISSSSLTPTSAGTALFSGEVSLSQGGGFASVRSCAAPRRLVGTHAVVLRARGDGKCYRLRLRTTRDSDSVSYLAPFQTRADTWHEFVFAADDFTASWRGRSVPDAAALDLGEVQSFGLLIADGQAGPFALEVAWIAKL